MNSHWPILVGTLMIAAAVGLGLWQRELVVTAAQPRPLTMAPIEAPPATGTPPVKTSQTPAQPNAPAPNPVIPVNPANPNNTAKVVTTPALAQPQTPAVPGATPVQPVNKPKRTFSTPSTPPGGAQPQPTPTPLVPTPLVPTPPAPIGAIPAAPAANDATDRQKTQALLDLRAALQNKLGVLAADLPNKVFFVNLDGARIEVQPAPNWTISIFNINAKTPDVETDNFKRILETVVTALKLDMTQPAIETPNQKKFVKTTSTLGNVSLVRDMANGNSATIRPVEIRAAQPTPPAPPVPPQPNPAKPEVKKDKGDGNF